MIKKITKFIKERRIVSGTILILLVISVYFGFKLLGGGDAATSYVLAAAEKGTITSSVAGSGQVSASNQVDVKSKVSGEIVYVNAKVGQEVKAGALLAQVDAIDAQESVRDAGLALKDAKLTLGKMQGMSTDNGSIRGSVEKAQEELNRTYDDAIDSLDEIFLDLGDIMTDLNDIIFSYDYTANQSDIVYYANAIGGYTAKAFEYEDKALEQYQIAERAYSINYNNYELINKYSDRNDIESLIDETKEALESISSALKSTIDLIKLYQNQLTMYKITPQSLSDTQLSNLNSYLPEANNHASNLLSIQDSIVNNKEEIINIGFDISDQELQVTKAENALTDAKNKLSDYYIRAPFSGTIATTDITKGDTVGSSTTIVTLITNQKIAEISLNEIDAAQIKLGQKTTLTFDAVEDLTITGEVVEADIIGTVSQGVVSYNVKISFDTQDERIKAGMTVSAAIITNTKQNVLLVPNSAIKTLGNVSYVEIPNEKISLDAASTNSGIILTSTPNQREIEIGLSNDSYTEIVSGLEEGDKIIIRTITSGSNSTGTNQNNMRMQGGGGMMMIR